MRTMILDEPDDAVGITKRNQLFTQQHDPDRIGVGSWQLRGQHGGQPVLAHKRTHGRAWPDARNEIVVLLAEHVPSGE